MERNETVPCVERLRSILCRDQSNLPTMGRVRRSKFTALLSVVLQSASECDNFRQTIVLSAVSC